MITFEIVLLVVTGVFVALLAGVFFGYAVSVNGALHRLKDVEYVRAMQAINVVIQNPLFLSVFMLPVILLPWVTFLVRANSVVFWLLLIASVLYIVGSFGVTVAGNVPFNERLARAPETDASNARRTFEKPWNRLHTVRTLASVAATILIFLAAVNL